MENLSSLGSAALSVVGIVLIAASYQYPKPYGALLLLLGAIAIYAWERIPWTLTAELRRVCNRLDMHQIDLIYDEQTEQVKVLVISKDAEVQNDLDISVEPGGRDAKDKV